MLAFLIDNIYALFGGRIFHHIFAFLWVLTVFPFSPSYCFTCNGQTSYFIRSTNIDDVISLNNCTLCDFVDHIFRIAFEINDSCGSVYMLFTLAKDNDHTFLNMELVLTNYCTM